MSCELWTINRWLRWTGFRIYFEVDLNRERNAAGTYKPTRIGLRFYGWRDLRSGCGRA